MTAYDWIVFGWLCWLTVNMMGHNYSSWRRK